MTANCNGTITENSPLYPSIWVPMPQYHLDIGRLVADGIVRLNPAGQEASNGRKVLAGLGMSNQKQQFAALMEAYRLKYGRSRPTSTVNLGTGNWSLDMMIHQMEEYRQLLLDTMIKKRVTREQVQIILFKNSIRFQDKAYPNDVNEYVGYLEILRNFFIELFPNLAMWFQLYPVYSGYASSSAPRHEPFVFREGIAVDEFIKRHYGQTEPWIGPGPHYWANGLQPRAGDELIWKCDNFAVKDGVHPSALGLKQTTDMLMRFFEQSPVTGWFTTG